MKLRKFRFEKLGRELRKNFGKEKAKSGENKMEKEITWIEWLARWWDDRSSSRSFYEHCRKRKNPNASTTSFSHLMAEKSWSGTTRAQSSHERAYLYDKSDDKKGEKKQSVSRNKESKDDFFLSRYENKERIYIYIYIHAQIFNRKLGYTLFKPIWILFFC